MRRTSLPVLSSLLTFCIMVPVAAPRAQVPSASTTQRAETGTISGVVTEAASGNPVTGARVAIAATQLGATTGPEGRFTIANVPVGSHTVQVRMIGYTALERTVT